MTAAILCAYLAAQPQAHTAVAEPEHEELRAAPKSHAMPPPQERIDINHAGMDELMKVPGMTHSWGGRIMRFRPYFTKEDLLDLGVVNSQVYDRIKDYVIAHRDKP
jgi:DNA uptake protein ComE-like DNA-binding protein